MSHDASIPWRMVIVLPYPDTTRDICHDRVHHETGTPVGIPIRPAIRSWTVDWAETLARTAQIDLAQQDRDQRRRRVTFDPCSVCVVRVK